MNEDGVELQSSRARLASIRLASNPLQSSGSKNSAPNVAKRRKRRSPEKKMKEVRVLESNDDSCQVVPVTEKKPSDEESGLDLLDSLTDQPPHTLRHRRGFKCHQDEIVKKTAIKSGS